MRFLSENSLKRGWTYVLVPPGTLYFVFVRPPGAHNHHQYRAMFDTAQPWRVEVPKGSKLVYAGTIAVEGDRDSLVFSGEYLKNFEHIEILDERTEAQRLMKESLPGFGKIETLLMQRHKGPIILKTPTNWRLSFLALDSTTWRNWHGADANSQARDRDGEKS